MNGLSPEQKVNCLKVGFAYLRSFAGLASFPQIVSLIRWRSRWTGQRQFLLQLTRLPESVIPLMESISYQYSEERIRFMTVRSFGAFTIKMLCGKGNGNTFAMASDGPCSI